ncbi:hypothetical protein LguiA_015415 [Lonicera macranthoides]
MERRFKLGALEHLASIDLIELCNEAKVEHCRATRDLRSCGRCVQSVLISCGHASLCDECSQRCDICPICRIPIPKNGNRLRLRLYSECIEAGLISKRCDDRFQGREDGDVQRLYSLFDVAMENNLISLICHYVTDVCMDESAVSSDPSVAILLDEVVVKDWCKRSFRNIITELQGIYNLTVQMMNTKLSSFLKLSVRLAGLSNVLEVLESSLKGSLSAQLQDLHRLQESVLKTKQHMEMIMWCIRHQFLENIGSRHSNLGSWRSVVRERKSAAIKRSWPNLVNNPSEPGGDDGSTLFIEHALSNLDIEQGYECEMGEEPEITSLQKDSGLSFFRSKIEGMAGCYPFENLHAAVDILFLRGSSDLVVAKQAIFLYYLFDRHWTMPDEDWRHIIDDFAATFNITRHSLLESFTFYLLDDHTDEALQDACLLLPEISGPTTHPKVAQVLLERQNPDAALMVLRWSGRDGGAQLVSLGEAITAIRVRVECGLLTEAFMYQRTLCTKVKDKKLRHKSSYETTHEGGPAWMNWVESLVTEICCLCVRRNLVDRMIELPWNCDEEKHLHKCLLDCAVDDPSTTVGSLLVVFYLQRYRYIEAYQVDRKLQSVEQDVISQSSASEEVIFKMRSASHWRARMVEKSLELLPEIQQQQAKSGKLPKSIVSPANEEVNNNALEKSHLPKVKEPNITTGLLLPSFIDSSSIVLTRSSKPLVPQTPSNLLSPHFELRNYTTSSPSVLFNNGETGHTDKPPLNSITKSFKFDDITTPAARRVNPVTAAVPLGKFNRSSSRVPQNSKYLRDDRLSPEKEQNGFINQFLNSSPYSRRVVASPQTPLMSSQGVFKGSVQEPYSNRLDKARNLAPSVDLMDISWSREEEGEHSVEDENGNQGPRWRSDDASEDEEEQQQSPSRGSRLTGIRRSRFARR